MSDTAIAHCFSLYREELYRFIVGRVGCRDTAQDILHDTFVRLMDFTRQGKVESPRPFLYQVAGNLIIDHYRRNRNRSGTPMEEQELVAIPDPAPPPDEIAAARNQCELLQYALDELPPRCREVFILLKFKHYSYAQVEKELGISSAMVFKHMHKALEHCRRRLDL